MGWFSVAVAASCLLVAASMEAFSGETLTDALSHYETLHQADIYVTRRDRRDVTSGQRYHEKDISFNVLGRQFQMRMHVQRGLFSKNFKAHVVDEKNRKTFLVVDRENFLEGHLMGVNDSSRVHAYWEGKDLSAVIVTREDTFIIEPAWRHLPVSKHYSMIAYRKSSLQIMKKEHPSDHAGASFCGFVHAGGEDEGAYDKSRENDIWGNVARDVARDVAHDTARDTSRDAVRDGHGTGGRWRRAAGSAGSADTCTLHLVADFHFFQDIGRNSASTTARFLVGQMQRVDHLFRMTHFQGYTGMGFEIKDMTLYSKPTSVAAGETHHNMAKSNWDTKELLRAFARNTALAEVCLGHLFTSVSFGDGVLGLAWIASNKPGDQGGICSPPTGGYHFNSGWTTMRNKYGRRILQQESELVTTHEFGHNWGSSHDPATTECAPSAFSSGKYIMYTYSVSGYEDNNEKFSPCSTRTMAAVLATKAALCFTSRSASFCGNQQVEAPYEQCDEGRDATHACCGTDCRLLGNAACSDGNTDCCTNCQPTVAGTVCRDTNAEGATCEGSANCDGTSPDCPKDVWKPDGTACIDGGKCEAGTCVSFCGVLGLLPCICPTVNEACLTCCRANTSGTCSPYMNGTSTIWLGDGKPCVLGRCASGVCEKLVAQLSDRLWSIIENLDIDSLVVFLRNNIVATCLFLSLLLHVPICLIIACVDWRREKKDKEEIEWHDRQNETLYLEKDRTRIKKTHSRKRPVTVADGRQSTASSSRTNRVHPQ